MDIPNMVTPNKEKAFTYMFGNDLCVVRAATINTIGWITDIGKFQNWLFDFVMFWIGGCRNLHVFLLYFIKFT